MPTNTAAITAKALTITGLTAQDKVYTGTLPAALTGTAALAGIVGAEAVSLTGTAAGAFATVGVGAGKNVTVSGLTLTGGDAGNYTLTPLVLTAAITPVPPPCGAGGALLPKPTTRPPQSTVERRLARLVARRRDAVRLSHARGVEVRRERCERAERMHDAVTIDASARARGRRVDRACSAREPSARD